MNMDRYHLNLNIPAQMIGYVLLCLTTLAVALLTVATLTACCARLRRTSQVAFSVVAMLIVLCALAGAAVLGSYLQFTMHWTDDLYYPLLAMTILYALTAAVMLMRGLRVTQDESPVTVAATWPRGKLAIGLAVVLALQLITFWNLDLAARQRLATVRATQAISSRLLALFRRAASPRTPFGR